MTSTTHATTVRISSGAISCRSPKLKAAGAGCWRMASKRSDIFSIDVRRLVSAWESGEVAALPGTLVLSSNACSRVRSGVRSRVRGRLLTRNQIVGPNLFDHGIDRLFNEAKKRARSEERRGGKE